MESPRKMSTDTAIILGAGFSHVAGLPVTKELFETQGELPRWQSPLGKKNHEQVFQAYNKWKGENPDKNAEDWLLQLYNVKNNPLRKMIHETTWDNAIQFALSRLVNLPPGSNSHYYYGILSYQCHPVHQKFWNRVEREFGNFRVVTLNYDILVEQALHSDKSNHRNPPRCYYGGFMYKQVVEKLKNVITREKEPVQLGTEITLYKLHGSLNWAWEPHSPTLKIHGDLRAVYRCKEDFGTPAIIPPIPEKEIPPEFSQIWNEARKSLLECPKWLVCGFALPPYDMALKDFFKEILEHQRVNTILILDPVSKDLVHRWREICSASTKIVPLPGIPDAFRYDWGV